VADGTRLRLLRVRYGEGRRATAPGPGQPGVKWGPERNPVSPSGRFLVTSSDDGVTRLRDPATGSELGTLPAGAFPIGFERHSGALVTQHEGRGVERWPVRLEPGGRCVVGPPEPGVGLGYMPGLCADASVLALPAAGTNAGTRVLFREEPPRWVTAGPQRDVRFAAVSPDGRWLVAGSHGGGAVRAYDLHDGGKPVAELLPNAGRGRFSPDGEWVYVWGY